jgi:hypothetical protein
MAQGREQLHEGGAERSQGRLALDPGLGVCQRFEDALAIPRGTYDDSPIDQEEEDGRRLPEGDLGPVGRAPEVVFEVEADVTDRLLDQGHDVLVIPVPPVMGETASPSSYEQA